MEAGRLVLPARGVWTLVVPVGFVAAAVMFPAAAHLTGAPVRWLLPMHWPVILAGLLFGWRGGLTVGLLAPGTNWLLTGYPLLVKLLPMTVELAVYGFAAGWLREKAGWNGFAAVAVALVAGRLFFLVSIFLTGVNEVPFGHYVIAAMMPGLVAGAAQLVSLPLLAKYFLSRTD